MLQPSVEVMEGGRWISENGHESGLFTHIRPGPQIPKPSPELLHSSLLDLEAAGSRDHSSIWCLFDAQDSSQGLGQINE